MSGHDVRPTVNVLLFTTPSRRCPHSSTTPSSCRSSTPSSWYSSSSVSASTSLTTASSRQAAFSSSSSRPRSSSAPSYTRRSSPASSTGSSISLPSPPWACSWSCTRSSACTSSRGARARSRASPMTRGKEGPSLRQRRRRMWRHRHGVDSRASLRCVQRAVGFLRVRHGLLTCLCIWSITLLTYLVNNICLCNFWN